VRNLFQKAKTTSPCIIFIDELDAVGTNRNNFQSTNRATLNQLLVEMDGFKDNSGIVVIAATNRPEDLDNALTRPGRFDRKISINLPDQKERREMIKFYLKGRESDDLETRLTMFSKLTEGFSGAEIANMVNSSAILTVKKNLGKVTFSNMRDAFDDIVMGLARPSLTVSDQAKTNTAHHEAGHALLALRSDTSLYKATVIPRGNALGHVYMIGRDEHQQTREEFLNSIDTAMAGRAAESIIFGEDKITSGASSDLAKATKLARSMVASLGMTTYGMQASDVTNPQQYKMLAPETRAAIDKEVDKILAASYDRTHKYLKANEISLRRLAEAMLEYQTLDSAEIKAAVNGQDVGVLVRKRLEEEEKMREKEQQTYGGIPPFPPPIEFLPHPNMGTPATGPARNEKL